MSHERGVFETSAGILTRALLVGTVLVGCGGDGGGGSSNRSPIISSVTVSPQAVNAGDSATVTVSATDPDGDQLVYTYGVSGGTIIPAGPTARWTLPTTPGAYTVSVSVSDGELSAQSIGGATVSSGPQNRAPVIGSITVTPPSVSPGGSATITVTASDPDGDELSYSYAVSGGGAVSSGPTAQWTLPATPGSYTVSVSVSDGELSTEGIAGAVVSPGTITRIQGRLDIAPGGTGDLAGARVGIFTTHPWSGLPPATYTTAIGSGTRVSYVIDNVLPGNYYIAAAEDVDGNEQICEGDMYGWYASGQPPEGPPILFSVGQGETRTINLLMYVLSGEYFECFSDTL